MKQHVESASDAQVIELVRAGSAGAYSILYSKYVTDMQRYARSISRGSADDPAEDAVETAFVQMYQALLNGKGPDENVRAYLTASVRHEVWRSSRRRRRREETVTKLHGLRDTETTAVMTAPSDVTPVGVVAEAFASLPDRWRTILWLSEVEGRDHQEIANLYELSPNSAAALLYRAKAGLRKAIFQRYASAAPSEECGPVAEQILGEGVDVAGATTRSHLANCAACDEFRRELGSRRSVGALLPLAALSAGVWCRLDEQPAAASTDRGAQVRAAVAVAAAAAVLAVGLVVGFRDPHLSEPTEAASGRRPVADGVEQVAPSTSNPPPTRPLAVPTTTTALEATTTTAPGVAPPDPGPSVLVPGAPLPPALAPSGIAPATLSGSVVLRSSSLQPVAGVPVQVVDPAGTVRQAVTDLAGRWQVSGLVPGAYRVRSSVPVALVPVGSTQAPPPSGQQWSVDVGQASLVAGSQVVLPLELAYWRRLVVGDPTISLVPLGGNQQVRWAVPVQSEGAAASGFRLQGTLRFSAEAVPAVGVLLGTSTNDGGPNAGAAATPPPLACTVEDLGGGVARFSCPKVRLDAVGSELVVDLEVAGTGGTLRIDASGAAPGAEPIAVSWSGSIPSG